MTVTDESALTAAYRYDAPPELVAQRPAEPRDSARLLILQHGRIGHAVFADLPAYLGSGDLLVLNETRVIPARLAGRRPTGGQVEVVLLHPAAGPRYDPEAKSWLALTKPARRLPLRSRIEFGDLGFARVTGIHEGGVRELEFTLKLPFESFLFEAGKLPLPPYVAEDSEEAQRGYQTVFAREPGSVAAPTASLHFTEALLEKLAKKGVRIVKLVLDVGLGTFRPIQTERVDDHVMHAEPFFIPQQTAAEIELAKQAGRRVVAAGTTVVRALEASHEKHGSLRSGPDIAELFIKPGFRFQVVDALITNFHLPQSTLLVLVSAFAGREPIARAYREAIELKYRLFSFGDAMLIEP